eukprot:TRINITY_DN51214_c0_g1_i1.p1 TRINITY_DN51214_c0_g1~~TRINITY_DN51214_c0_g1_i1.p1  ORF type:complete len:206 (+),score=32.46 TRINITY_DN51214_c0_g1_i1:92-709(+)
MAAVAEIAKVARRADCDAQKSSPLSTCSTADSVECSWTLVDFERYSSHWRKDPNVQEAVLQRMCDVYTVLSSREIPGGPRTAFHSKCEPCLKIAAYFKRIREYFQNSNSSNAVAFILIDRVLKVNSDLISRLSLHRFLAVATLVGTKFTDDVYYSNAYYAKVCGMSLQELNRLEACFLRMLDWKVAVDVSEIDAYSQYLTDDWSA